MPPSHNERSIVGHILILLTKFDASLVLKFWFFGVVIIALALSFIAIVPYFRNITWLALLAALPFAYLKIFTDVLPLHGLWSVGSYLFFIFSK